MRKLALLLAMLLMLGMAVGCGDDREERLREAQEAAQEALEKAQDATDRLKEANGR
ncbi:MAG: DUF3050 domain-containing protein [Ruminococcaceae bacterium]|nr:DUF3050 domain-containing protein [Oscillospiraceae bacterium]